VPPKVSKKRSIVDVRSVTNSFRLSRVRSKNTRPELLLGKALWRAGLRYRKHINAQGSPDFALVSQRVAIFVDGDFWHGRNWRTLRPRLKNDFWRLKILRNRKRDRAVGRGLAVDGWTVLRFWESDVRQNVDRCVKVVLSAYARKGGSK
jgi:DNA mismatch endonuclease (patch repair protein)